MAASSSSQMADIGEAVIYLEHNTTIQMAGLVVSTHEGGYQVMKMERKVSGKKRPGKIYDYVDCDRIVDVPSTSIVKVVPMAVMREKDEPLTEIFSLQERRSGCIYVVGATPDDFSGTVVRPLTVIQKLAWYHYRPGELEDSPLLYDDHPFTIGGLDFDMLVMLKEGFFDRFVSPLSHTRRGKSERWNLAGWKLFIQRALGKITDEDFLSKMKALQNAPRRPELYYCFKKMAPVMVACLREWLTTASSYISSPYTAYEILHDHIDIFKEIFEDYEAKLGVDDCDEGDEEEEEEEGENLSYITEDRSDVTEEDDSDEDSWSTNSSTSSSSFSSSSSSSEGGRGLGGRDSPDPDGEDGWE
jgi:hypothetical protein